MSGVRKFIIAIAILALAVTALYPPWLYRASDGSEHAMGYSVAWQPPVYQRKASADIFGLTIDLKMEPVRANSIDLATLFKNWLLVLGVGAGAWALTLLPLSANTLRRSTHGTVN